MHMFEIINSSKPGPLRVGVRTQFAMDLTDRMRNDLFGTLKIVHWNYYYFAAPEFPTHFCPPTRCITPIVDALRHSVHYCQNQVLMSYSQAFENASTNIAAAQMRNELTKLAESVDDPDQKKVRLMD